MQRAGDLPAFESGSQMFRYAWKVGGTKRAFETESMLREQQNKPDTSRRSLSYTVEVGVAFFIGHAFGGAHVFGMPLQLAREQLVSAFLVAAGWLANSAVCSPCLQDPTIVGRPLLPPRMRPVSSMEPRAYLAQPQFSSCTVPIIWLATWSHNMGHALRGEWNAGMLRILRLFFSRWCNNATMY